MTPALSIQHGLTVGLVLGLGVLIVIVVGAVALRMISRDERAVLRRRHRTDPRDAGSRQVGPDDDRSPG